MKKTRLLFTAFLTTTLAIAQTTFVDNNIQYKVLNATDVEVTSKTGGYTGSVTITTTATDSNTNTTYDVTAIGDFALGDVAVTAVSIPNSVTTIGFAAFNGAGLTTITIPNSVTTIGNSAFGTCASLTSINIGTSVTTIGDGAFADSGLTSITIPNSVTAVGANAFNNCRSLTSVTLSNSITTIEKQTFVDCVKLISITIPNSVTTIEDEAFSSCQDLTAVSIPDSVTSIGTNAFSNCTSLATVNVAHTMPLTIMANVFLNVTLGNVALNVPTGSKAAYEAVAVWQDFGTINATLSLSPTALAAALSVRYLPNQQLLHIETNGIAMQEVQFYDVTGRGLFSKALSTKKTIDVSNLQTGVYVVKIEGIAKKFVKY